MPDERGDRTVVVPEAFFVALGARLRKDLGRNPTENILYELGRDAGRAFVRMAQEYLGGPVRTAEEFERVVMMFGKDYRWADVEIRTLDVPGKYMAVEWRNGVGVPKSGSQRPWCHLGRGLFSGAAEVFLGEPCDAIETQCEAMGADHCEIFVGVPSRIAEIAEGAN